MPSSLHPCLVYSHPNPGHPAAPDKLQSSSWRHSTTNSAPLAYWGVTPELSPAVIHEQPPKPPHKELGSQPNRMPYRGDGRLDVVTLNEDDEDVGVRRIHEKVPPLVEGPAGLVERELGHRVSQLNRRRIIEIIVGEAYKQPEFTVTRRYRDFLWLYNQLITNNPGVVVPPPPEKQAIGMFDNNFVVEESGLGEDVESAAHPILQHDADLKLFLESEAFNVDVRRKGYTCGFSMSESCTSMPLMFNSRLS
ncbi:hypothetical protein L211DRAFT_865842 [Terfezia boudieri ATCC MYA-4762]|uniref:PX domain-containing protein n=1 Tax=Terfezia boudieri ATCC MYA-4762 TaxID=1051890 RepID=A0A3N4LXX0_9PEZI|nr:hypothetical protein L211DRAFT_865842 [Terfezia boudieri ATCC MYA-4762]